MLKVCKARLKASISDLLSVMNCRIRSWCYNWFVLLGKLSAIAVKLGVVTVLGARVMEVLT